MGRDDVEVQYLQANTHYIRVVRKLTPQDATCKLALTDKPDHILMIAYHVAQPGGDKHELLSAMVPIYDTNSSVIPAAFGAILKATPWPVSTLTVERAQSLVSDVVRAAESFGLTYRDVFQSRTGNVLHNWAGCWMVSDEVMRALLAGAQSAEPSAYRQMLNEPNQYGKTPYETAVARNTFSNHARLFQPIGPKSAAATE